MNKVFVDEFSGVQGKIKQVRMLLKSGSKRLRQKTI